MKKKFNPESQMMSYGYNPELSEGALKCPIFQTSTFVFKTAEDGKAFCYRAVSPDKGKQVERHYSRCQSHGDSRSQA